MSGERPPAGALDARLGELLERRTTANRRFFDAEAERVARLCHRMAERFARGGRLVALGVSPAARSDVRHVAVEFVHPVIVGKRALPALGLTREGGPLAAQAALLLEPDDIALAFGGDAPGAGAPGARAPRAGPPAAGAPEADTLAAEELLGALDVARSRGCLTVAFSPIGAEWEFEPPTDDPFVRQELIETLYHVLWELVHVFFEHRGLLEGRQLRSVQGAGASSFLYPFLAEEESDLETVVADVRRSVGLKAGEVGELRIRTVEGGAETLLAAAAALRETFDGGGTLLVLGNGGSATDAMDAVADFRGPPQGWPRRAALDLTEDAAILTAIANDIGTDALFSRQIIAYGRPGDAVLALSTSGSSRNVIQALEEARRRNLLTIALVGYDGGRVLAEGLADHVIVTPSQHIPRIQEAQATAYHLLRELIEMSAQATFRDEDR